jgi:DNA repair exonuclease SbcCD ATPase subunit
MKNVNFCRVAIQHFLSVGEDAVSIDFSKGLHVITGINYDKPDRRNAIGKSTIADAIYFAIFGETLRDIKKDLISNNITSGNTHVELDFNIKTPAGTSEYKIIRKLGPSKVFIYKDGKDKTRDSISNTNKYISDVMSATPSVFKNCVIMTVNNAIPFMAKNKIEKRKFIEDIFGMEVFSQMLSILRSEYNDTKREFEIEQAKLNEIQTTYAEYIQQQNDILEKRKQKRGLYKNRQQENINKLSLLKEEINQHKEYDLSSIEESINRLNSQLIECESKITTYIENISSEKAKITHLKKSLLKIGTEEDTCPVCLKSIEHHDKVVIDQEKDQLKAEIREMVEDIKRINEFLNNCKRVKDTICNNINKKNKELSDAKLAEQRISNTNDKIEQIVKWQKELEVDLEIVDSTNTDFDNLIEISSNRISELSDKVSSFKKQLSKLDVVKYVVSEEGVKSYIVNKLLELLNSKLLHYLKKLDSNSICIFNEYFEEEIINEKNKVCSYFNFSGAERKSIDLACLFTFSDIRRLQGNVKYNIAIYDELLDSSFDEKGCETLTQILQDRSEELDECCIIISHRKESIKAVTGETIFLEKRNGITRRVAYTEI